MRTRWVSRGFQVFDYGADPDDYCYVIQGSLWLTDRKEEHMQAVDAVSREEALPLPYVLPTAQRATATTDAKLLLVDRRRLAQVLSTMSVGFAHAGALTSRAKLRANEGEAEGWQAAMLR